MLERLFCQRLIYDATVLFDFSFMDNTWVFVFNHACKRLNVFFPCSALFFTLHCFWIMLFCVHLELWLEFWHFRLLLTKWYIQDADSCQNINKKKYFYSHAHLFEFCKLNYRNLIWHFLLFSVVIAEYII